MTLSKAQQAERAAKIAATNAAAIQDPGSVASEHVTKPSSSGEKVVVGLKLGIAWYDIYLCRLEENVPEQSQTGIRYIKRYTPMRDTTVRLRGTAYPRGTLPDGFPEKPTIVDGAALNFGVDKDFFDAWLKQNEKNPIVVNKMIFGVPDVASARSVAAELKGIKSGLDPVDPRPGNDDRMPKSTRADVSNVETEDSRKGKVALAAQTA
jgi:hypothetical protein